MNAYNIVFLTSLLLSYLTDQLISANACVYNGHDKGVIDLSTVGNVDGTPMWKDLSPETPDDHLYSYNPCHPFSENKCHNVAACQTYPKDQTIAYSLGAQNSIKWKLPAGQDLPTITYATNSRTLNVDLRCLSAGQPDQLVVHGQDPKTKIYSMTLSSKCACWDACKKKPTPSGNPTGLTAGAIFIILLIALTSIYLIAFVLFNKFKRQATGMDILPHRTFWVSLPRYSIDGVKFTFNKITGKETNYTAIP